MKHNIRIEGHAYTLRPVELEDAEFIVELRTPERSRFMHRIDSTVEAQREWLERYFQRPNEYYFVIERKRDRNQEGLTSLLDFDGKKGSAQWGRFILRPGSFSAIEATLLTLELAFGMFGLNEVWGVALLENVHLIAFCDLFGFQRSESATLNVDGELRTGTKGVLTKERWEALGKRVGRPPTP
jgi:RimJ/RimL family protein N-acetyltransferase